MNAGRFAGIFAELIAVSNPGAGHKILQLRVHVSTIMQYLCRVHVYMYTYTYALCSYTRHLRTCRNAAILINRPSGISQAAAIAANRTKGVHKDNLDGYISWSQWKDGVCLFNNSLTEIDSGFCDKCLFVVNIVLFYVQFMERFAIIKEYNVSIIELEGHACWQQF